MLTGSMACGSSLCSAFSWYWSMVPKLTRTDRRDSGEAYRKAHKSEDQVVLNVAQLWLESASRCSFKCIYTCHRPTMGCMKRLGSLQRLPLIQYTISDCQSTFDKGCNCWWREPTQPPVFLWTRMNICPRARSSVCPRIVPFGAGLIFDRSSPIWLQDDS